MGQYWMVVNLDKKEFVCPHKLGSGLKLVEQLGSYPGTSAALIVLCAAQRERRGGGDLDIDENGHNPEPAYLAVARRTIGRWAGDRIAIVGDYAEDSDLPKSPIPASQIFDKCMPETHEEYKDEPPAEGSKIRVMDHSKNHGKYLHILVDGEPEFKDISGDVCAVIGHELNGEFVGEGWREFKRQ